jgi:ABC-type Fe3+-hydroxamate transport system substrate-binding protein
MMERIGQLTGRESEASTLTLAIRNDFQELAVKPPRRVLYLIWRNPWMVAGLQTFIHDIITRIGWSNAINHPRYPVVTNEEIRNLEPELILLSSEPYPFRDKHREELRQICPQARIILVDGEMFSWYGSRLTMARRYFSSLEI